MTALRSVSCSARIWRVRRYCLDCGAELWPEKNWTRAHIHKKHYLCRRCSGRRKQRERDGGYAAILMARQYDRYDTLARERGECADHLENFGYRLLYDPEFRAIFQWDHRFGPKSFRLNASGFQRSLETLRVETDKCALVCANCHSLATQRAWVADEKPDWVINKRTTRIDYADTP